MKHILIAVFLIGFSLATPLNQEEDVVYLQDPDELTDSLIDHAPINQEEDDVYLEDPAELPDPLIDYLQSKWDKTTSHKGRIVGGFDTTILRAPWHIGLFLSGSYICGGSILTPERGLTAGHCVRPSAPSSYSIMAGSTRRLGDQGAIRAAVVRIIRHPQYNPQTIRNDVAVLWFANRLQFGPRIQRIGLPAQGTPVTNNAMTFVTGWGLRQEGVGSSLADILQYTVKPVVSNQACNVSYSGRISDDMLCAGLRNGGRDACQGDSGGALIINGVQHGIVSWGRGCARPNFPGVYTRVSFFTNWIRSVC